MPIRLGFANEALVYDTADTEKDGTPKAGAAPLARVFYRDPTTEESVKFAREYFAAVTLPNAEAGAAAAEVLSRFGADLVTGCDGFEFPDGVDPSEGLRRWGHAHLVRVAQRAYLTSRAVLDLGKSGGSPAPSSEGSSAGSNGRPATS